MKAPVRSLFRLPNKRLFRLFIFFIAFSLLLPRSSGAFSRVSVKTSPDASLSALKLSAGVLDPAFNPDVTSYAICIDPAISSETVIVKTKVSTSSVTVNDLPIAPGDTTVTVPLKPGANVITIVVIADDGATTQSYSINVTRSPVADTDDDVLAVNEQPEKPSFDDDVLVVHRGITPNGDGIDDYLVIDGILAYPDNKLTIVNRNGQLIYESKGYDNSTKVFDGRSSLNGQMQQPGTYFFELDYAIGGVVKHKTGFIVLKY